MWRRFPEVARRSGPPSERFADWRGRAVPTIGEPPLSEDEAIARSVLIVDDSTAFQGSARALLEARGYAIAGTAADGAGALEAVRALRPDAVLLDVNLPDMNGVDVAERLARDDATLAVVLVSTLEVSALGRSVDACGARGFVAKSELASPRLVDLLGPPDG